MRKRVTAFGYVVVSGHGGHPRAHKSCVLEHLLIAEKALGHALPPGAQVHHLDGDKTNNVGRNLVICEDAAYHKLLHLRAEALAACGHAGWRKCSLCQSWSDPADMMRTGVRTGSGSWRHVVCWRLWQREYRRAKGKKHRPHQEKSA